jgi:hypothetical protein
MCASPLPLLPGFPSSKNTILPSAYLAIFTIFAGLRGIGLSNILSSLR